ncbi:GGDEF domain-containing protein, partial [Oxalobacteraceae bacterium OM1]
ELANDPATNLMQIADCVACDPALATKILKAANSPLYTRRRSATNVRQAVNLMGTHAATSIALSFSLARNLSDAATGGNATRYWKRSVCAALACRVLAERFELDRDDLFLVGLLQDIGILALNTAFGERYARFAEPITDHDELLRAERAEFGSGHDEVGYWLLKRWNLPDHIALACLTSHGQPQARDRQALFDSCVAVSGYFADVFLNPGDSVSTLKLGHAALQWLRLEPAAVAAVMDEMRAGLQEMQDLFDVSVIDAHQADALVAEARELLLVANLGQMRDLDQRTQRDGLTGIYNRTHFERVLREELDAAARHGWPLSLALIDVDHFKHVNDAHGHAAGDSALISLTRVISAQLRNGDLFARYGGEEFILLLPGTPADTASAVLTRIKDTVAKFDYPLSDAESLKLTISAGIATAGDTGGTITADMLLRAADAALYAAKHKGRNQVAAATEFSAR